MLFNDVLTDYYILNDISSTGTERPWADKKIKSLAIADSYTRIGYYSKADRVRECGTFLEFKRFTSDNTLKLNHANFCKVRLCSTCSWRRSLKVFGQVSKIMNEATKDNNYSFLFLTLTVRNCNGSELNNTLDLMIKGYDKLFKRRRVDKSILGAFRALEITHNVDIHSKDYNTFHPHFHCILLVNKSYFKKSYISQNEWCELWGSCIDADYKPIVHIAKISNTKKNIEKSIAEVAKYSVKDSDIISFDDLELQDNTVKILDDVLCNRRLISFRGIFSKIQKELKLDDILDGDLVNCDIDDEIRNDLDFVIERYRWHLGYNNYVRLDSDNNYV